MLDMNDPLPKPTEHFTWVQGVHPALVCTPLLAAADHLFSTTHWTLGRRRAAVHADAWGEVARALGVGPDRLFRVHQVHGAAVVIADEGEGTQPVADIIISNRSDLALAVQAADCVPLLVADRRTGAVAAAHAGWRGLAVKVPGTTIAALARQFGSHPADLVAAIGPSIGPCCYEVGADVRDTFGEAFPAGESDDWFARGARPDKWFFDTWTSARAQLEAAGVPPDQVFEAGLCTASHPDVFCSYRRDGQVAGRIAGAIRSQKSEGRIPNSKF
jgi:YfiH family protein